MRFGKLTPTNGGAIKVYSAALNDTTIVARLLLTSAKVFFNVGAAGERIGYDRWLKANTVKRRTHSLFRQGLMLYHHLPNWPEDRIRPLMETFGSMLMEQRVYREVFGVI